MSAITSQPLRPKPESHKVRYIRSLDKLRAIAVLLVLFTHAPLSLLGEWGLNFRAYVVPGYLGVDIFFALSGFLITRILLKEKQAGATMRSFWIRRAIRIFPACYLLLAIVWLVSPGPEMIWVATYTSNFYFLGNVPHSPLGHTWSLAVEEHFYLVWPLLLFGLSRRRAEATVVLGLIPLSIATAFFVIAKFPNEQLQILSHVTPARILTLALGSLLAFHETSIFRRPWTFCSIGIVGAIIGYLWALCGFLIPALRPYAGLHQLLGLALLSTSILLLFIQADRLSLPKTTAILGTPLAYIGRISYGLYLYHLPIFYALSTTSSSPAESGLASRTALAIALSFLAASISYYAFERPLLKWGERFRG